MRIRRFGICLVTLFAVPAVGAASASAALPEWSSPFPKHFTSVSETKSTFETENKSKVTCTGATNSGEVTGPKSGNVTITFKGCEFSGLKCTTQGAGSGEIVTSELSATLLYTNAEKKKVGLELAPAPGELFTSFDCVTTEVKVRGSVTGAITPTNKKVKPKGHFTLAVKKSKLEMAFRSAGYEHAALTFTDELSFAETTEIKA